MRHATWPRRRRRRRGEHHAGPGRAARTVRSLQRAVLDLAALLGVLSVVVTIACLVLGIRPAVVVSGSMEPKIGVGALTAARSVPAGSVEVGDVVTVPRVRADGLVTHRVVSTEPAEVPGLTRLELKGDANAEPDPEPYVVDEVGEVVLSVPGLGRVVLLLQDNVVAVVAGLVAVSALVTMPVGRRAGDPSLRS